MRTLLVAALTSIALSAPVARPIDVARSKATFEVTHVFVEHVVGTVPIQSGTIVLKPGSAIPISAAAVLDATRISSGDPDRDASLRSTDFFDAKRFPTWTFASTKVVPKGVASFEMDGDLTIHGVTQPEHLDVTVTGDAADPSYHATAHIDRHVFGMATTRLDPAIGGVVDTTLDITLKP
ncbi:MAG TPA: YceI family protein [Candidatus Binatia bacterium]|nr:YceI family protein [Candidatus Binatia bacterium]